MNHSLQCRCGTLKGHVSEPAAASRAVCYCRDCQAYARFLGQAEAVLDEHGGTQIVATLPEHVHFTQGLEKLSCMSLSERGILRWYAGCCNTPIGNTPRDMKIPYVGLVAACLAGGAAALRQSFGPVRAVVNTESAIGTVKATPLRNVLAIFRLMKGVLGGRLGGSYKRTPFFDVQTGAPRVSPRVLTKTERERVTSAA